MCSINTLPGKGAIEWTFSEEVILNFYTNWLSFLLEWRSGWVDGVDGGCYFEAGDAHQLLSIKK